MTNLQPTLLNLKEHLEKWSHDHPNGVKSVTKLIGEDVAIDHLPYIHVEKPGFKRLIADAYPRYNLPSRTHFPSDETLNQGPLALLLQYEFPFGINIVQFSIFTFFSFKRK